MITAAALIAGLLALGQGLDRLGGRRLKLTALSVVRGSRKLNWHRFIANGAWSVYSNLFGNKTSSRHFFLRSAIAYFALLVGGLIFLLFAFPSTFYDATSALAYGGHGEIIGWMCSILAGGLLFVIANAQTLYFLEILKTAPDTFKFALVAYADLLITASLGLFGVPLIMTLSSAIAISGIERPLVVEYDFRQPVRSPTADLLSALDKKFVDEDLEGILKADEGSFFFEIKFAVHGLDDDFSRKDFELTKEYINGGEITDLQIFNDDTIRVISKSGDVLGFRDADQTFRDRVSKYEQLENNQTFAELKKKICADLAIGSPPSGSYTLYKFTSKQRLDLQRACTDSQASEIKTVTSFNYDNISLFEIYRTYLNANLDEYLRYATGSSQSYLTVSPYFALANPEINPVWINRHMLGDREDRYQIALDEVLFKALFADAGGYNYALRKGIPAGTISFAIMFTALFNSMLLLLFFIMLPTIKVLRHLPAISRYLRISEFPFTFSAFVMIAYVSALTLVVRFI